MDKQNQLPFKVGQLAESKSFESGFRGSWFRCKIKEMSIRERQQSYALEFFDFPDEKVKWTRIYQFPQRGRNLTMQRQLMVRPQYPPKFLESQMPHNGAIIEVTVVTSGVWKVGDLVDWWSDGCYWSGRVVQILDNDKVKVEFPPPPHGEGSSSEVFCKDLRPSLDWSPDHGWSVPISEEGENYCCARLIKPADQVDEGKQNVQAVAGSSFDTSFSSQISANSLSAGSKSKPPITMETPGQALGTQRAEANTDLDTGDSAIGKTSWSDSVSSSHLTDALAETAGHPAGEEEQYYCRGSSKKMRTGGNISLNCICSDTLEATILDLEELVNRVKWLKGILEFGVPLSTAGRPPWKFIEQRASSEPK